MATSLAVIVWITELPPTHTEVINTNLTRNNPREYAGYVIFYVQILHLPIVKTGRKTRALFLFGGYYFSIVGDKKVDYCGDFE